MSHHRDVCDTCCQATCLCGTVLGDLHDLNVPLEEDPAPLPVVLGRKARRRWETLHDESQGC